MSKTLMLPTAAVVILCIAFKMIVEEFMPSKPEPASDKDKKQKESSTPIATKPDAELAYIFFQVHSLFSATLTRDSFAGFY